MSYVQRLATPAWKRTVWLRFQFPLTCAEGAALAGSINRAARLVRTARRISTWALALAKLASLVATSNFALSKACAEADCVRNSAYAR